VAAADREFAMRLHLILWAALFVGFVPASYSRADEPATLQPTQPRSKADLTVLRDVDLVARGEMAPDFTLKSPTGQSEVTLSQFRGQRPVALIFGSFT
jgi:hypothetical protein